MPIYEYACAVCGHRTDILHGVHEPGPNFCPECGTEGSMRKAFAPPAIVFKGSGWAKKERRSSSSTSSSSGQDTATVGSRDGDSGSKDGSRPKDTAAGSKDTSGSASSSGSSGSGSD
jgi:putative FmdB family regulatory protein